MALPAPSRRLAGDLPAEFASRLAAASAEPNIEEAWSRYMEVATAAREHDLRLVSRVEGQLDEPPRGEGSVVFRPPSLVTERLRSEFQEVWFRLRGRTLALALKAPGSSLRTIAKQVGVSAPYLSQLTNGVGPVPSRNVLSKMEQGLSKGKQQVPQSPAPPDVHFETLDRRGEILRTRIEDLARSSALPSIEVLEQSGRVDKTLSEVLTSVALRSRDADDGEAVLHLLRAIVEEDGGLLTALAQLSRDARSVESALILHSLPNELRAHLQGLIKAVQVRPSVPAKQRRDKTRRITNDVTEETDG
jgi:transcriptional regulator with XRE-family HTH domain